MMFPEYPEYVLVEERIFSLVGKQVLPATTKLSFERAKKAIKQDSQLVLLGSNQHEAARKLGNLPDDVQFEDAEILLISRSDNDSQNDRSTKTKRIFRPEGPGTDFLENRSIRSMDFAYDTLFSHEAVYSLQHASYLSFEINGRVDADNLKRIQSVLALCRAELPYGVIHSTESTGPGELSEIANANLRDFESLFGHPVDYYMLDVDVDGFGVETDLLADLRNRDVVTRRGIAAGALNAGIQDLGNELLSRKAKLDYLASEKQTREEYDAALSKRIDFQKTFIAGRQPSLILEWERETGDATAEIRHQIVGKFSPRNGGELLARLKACIRNTKVNPRRRKQVADLISQLEHLLSQAADEAWTEATEAFKSQIVANTLKVLHELITDATHKWGVPEDRVSVSLSPRWIDGPDPKLNVDLEVSVVSSTGEVVFRLVISVVVFANLASQIGGVIGGPVGGIIGGIVGAVFGLLLGWLTLKETDRRNFKRHIEAESRSALVDASQKMGFQFDKLTKPFVHEAHGSFREIITAIAQHLDNKLAEFKHVSSLSADELDKQIRHQSQIYAELEALRQDMVALESKLSSPTGVEQAATAV